VLGRVGARRQLASSMFCVSPTPSATTRLRRLCSVQVVLDLIEIAVVGVGDLGGMSPSRSGLRTLPTRSAVRSLHRGLSRLDDLAEVALMLGRIGTGGSCLPPQPGECIRVLDQRPRPSINSIIAGTNSSYSDAAALVLSRSPRSPCATFWIVARTCRTLSIVVLVAFATSEKTPAYVPRHAWCNR